MRWASKILTAAAALAAALILAAGAPATARQGRLWPGFQWGRCLLEVDGRAYISGRCAYLIEAGGSFEIHGPRQIYSGIDYPRPEIYAGERSNDYFALVEIEGRSGHGHWNEDPRATHGYGDLGTLTRRGACWVNARARICLWRR
jgi:hypothetical protein